MSESIFVTTIATVAEGKWDRTIDLIMNMVKEVQEKEPGCLKYDFFEELNGDYPKTIFIAHEVYKDQAAWDAHFKRPHFLSVGEAIQNEGLLAAAFDVRITSRLLDLALEKSERVDNSYEERSRAVFPCN